MSRAPKSRHSVMGVIDQLAAEVGWHDLDRPALFRDSAIDEIDRYAMETDWHDPGFLELADASDMQDGPEPDFLDDAADEMVSILDGYLIAMKGTV